MSYECYIPTVFHRHHRALRALLIDDQVWFVAQDLGPLTNHRFDERLSRKLDPDQWRHARVEYVQGGEQEVLLINESAVFELLKVNFYHPEHRALRPAPMADPRRGARAALRRHAATAPPAPGDLAGARVQPDGMAGPPVGAGA